MLLCSFLLALFQAGILWLSHYIRLDAFLVGVTGVDNEEFQNEFHNAGLLA
jgi:hypothetical protein